MAIVFGMLADATTGFSAIGILRNFERTETAEAKHARDANGEPSDSNFVAGPVTASATVEITGTAPSAKAAITVGSDVFAVTKCTQKYSGDGDVYVADVELEKNY